MSVRDGLGFNNCCGKTQPTGDAKLSGLWKRGEHEPGKGAFMLLGLSVLHCGCDVTYFLVIWPPCCCGLWAIVRTVPVIYYSHKLTSMRIIHVRTWLKVKLEENQEIRDSSCFCCFSRASHFQVSLDSSLSVLVFSTNMSILLFHVFSYLLTFFFYILGNNSVFFLSFLLGLHPLDFCCLF